MNYPTHILGGVTVAALIVAASPNELITPAIITAAGVISGCDLPDIDKPGTHISHRHPLIQWILTHLLMVHHRTITHAILIPVLLNGLGFYLYSFSQLWSIYVGSFFIGLGIGWAVHLLLDMITPTGVPLFIPLYDRNYSIAHFNGKRDGWKFNVTFILAIMAIAWYQVTIK